MFTVNNEILNSWLAVVTKEDIFFGITESVVASVVVGISIFLYKQISSAMRRFSNSTRVLLSSIIIFTSTLLFFALKYEWRLASNGLLITELLLLTSLPLYLKARSGWNTWRKFTFGLFAIISTRLAFIYDWQHWIQQISNHKSLTLAFQQLNLVDSSFDLYAFVISFALYWIVTNIGGDNTAMGSIQYTLEAVPDDTTYKERMLSFSRSLERDLNNLDYDSQWSDQMFVQLDAEVEIGSNAISRRHITSLLNSLKGQHQYRFFLVLGDPGSGKSVALRKLARDLLQEVKMTGRIPIYLNLRDWRTPGTWTVTTPPTANEVANALSSWILQDLCRRLDYHAQIFLKKQYSHMVLNGRFFFILDSFDEIALLLNVPENHVIIHRFSEGLAIFFGSINYSRGVVASRLFRKPTVELVPPCTLMIRPLRSDRIFQLVNNRFDNKYTASSLLADRPDLMAVARNPFTAALLVEYMDSHRDADDRAMLPDGRADIFQDYLAKRLRFCREEMSRPDLDEVTLFKALEGIAETMFTQQNSFEVSARVLPSLLANIPVSKLLNALRRAHVLRLSPGEDPHASFTHRRFAEYLAARTLLDSEALPLGDIPEDSLWRDTMVLFCEIAPTRSAQVVAEYCWKDLSSNLESTLANSNSPEVKWLRTLHILRFLTEAYVSRPQTVASFATELVEYIKKVLGGANILVAKWALEAAAILDKAAYTEIFNLALNRNDLWLTETALRSGGKLTALDPPTFRRLVTFFETKSYIQLWRTQHELRFNLQLNPALRSVTKHCVLLLIDSLIWIISLCFLPIFSQSRVLLAIAFSLLLFRCLPQSFLYQKFLFMRMWIWLLILRISFPLVVIFQFEIPFYFILIPIAWIIGFYLNHSLFLREDNDDNENKPATLKEIVTFVGIGGLIFGFAILIVFLGTQSIESDSATLRITFGFLPAIIFLAFVALVARVTVPFLIAAPIVCAKFLSDLLYLKHTRHRILDIDRKWISDHWSCFRTSIGRILFVNQLALLRFVTGEWPSDPPYAKDGMAESRLARLDEQWRGLDN